MQTNISRAHLLSFLHAIALVSISLFVLAACSINANTNSSPSTPSAQSPTHASATSTSKTPTASTLTVTPPPNQASAHGCPNKTIVTAQPPAANALLKSSNNNVTIHVNKGNTIEVDLLFGPAWQGPVNATQKVLQMQTPSGYASSTAKACVWRFIATNAGTAQLTFVGLPICLKGQSCAMNAIDIEFTIDIK